MIRAIALIERLPARGLWYRILACPAAPDHEGAVFVAPQREVADRVGQYTVVRFSPDVLPDDQCAFAYECAEALEEPTPEEIAALRVARGLHPEPGPHCVECGRPLTEVEAAAQVPDCDEVCDACEAEATAEIP